LSDVGDRPESHIGYEKAAKISLTAGAVTPVIGRFEAAHVAPVLDEITICPGSTNHSTLSGELALHHSL